MIVLLDGMRASGARAEEQSAAGQNAGFEYTVQVSDAKAAEALDAAGLPRVTTTSGAAATNATRLDVTLVMSPDPRVEARYGVDIRADAGPVSGPVSVAISEAAARSLGVDVGASIRLTTDGLNLERVVGRVFSIPNEPYLRTAVAVLDAGAQPPGASRWLLDTPDFSNPAIEAALNDESVRVTVRSSRGIAQERTDVLDTGRFAALVYIGPFGLLFTLAAWTGVVTIARSRMLIHTGALRALGLSSSDARGVLRRACSAAAVTGALAGGLAGHLAVAVLYQMLGRVADQAWQTGAINLGRTVAFLTATVVGVLIVIELVLRSEQGHARFRLDLTSRTRALVGVGGLAAGALIYGASLIHLINPYGGALCCGLVLLPAAVALSRIVTDYAARVGPRHVVAAAQRATPTAWFTALVGAALVLSGSFLSAQGRSEYITGAERYAPLQPSSSILVTEADASTVDLVAGTWAAVDHGQLPAPWLLNLPDSSRTRFFASSPEFVQCAKVGDLRLGDESCPVPAETYVNPTDLAIGAQNAPGWHETGAPVVADPALISDGMIGLLATNTDGQIIDAWVVAAQPNAALGNLLPGAVVAPGSALAEELGLTASGYNQIVLDGSQLSLDDLDRTAATISAVVPASQVFVERGFEDAGLNAFTLFTGVGTAALAGSMMAIFGLGVVRSSRPLLEILDGLALARRTRWLLAAVMMADPVLAILAGPTALILTAPLWGSQSVNWATPVVFLPAATALAILATTIVTLGRAPTSTNRLWPSAKSTSSAT
ncbi:hypothetical protein [Xylanimonas sp. McL0601]|uniref:hypothetical protein n=1 Tax=Xylanimonas sp. McL0601 TaxID=3414739 RepID=UPI003CF81A34